VIWAGRPASLAIVTDVSKRKQAETALSALNGVLEARIAKRTEQLQATLENISEGLALFDSDDRLAFCNETYRRFFAPIADLIEPGVAYETLVRATLEQGIADHPGASVEDKVQARLAKHREPKDNFEVDLSDGRWLIISERKTADGGIVLVQTDITKVKQAEQQALSILDASPLAVGVSRISDGELLYVNAKYRELYGAPPSDRSAIDSWADPVDRERFLEIFRRDHRVPETEAMMIRRDGSRFWAEVAWERIPALGEDTLLFWNHDISDLAAARQDMQHAKEEAETANRAKSEFLSQMSHELRTPLNAVLGFAQVMRDFADPPLTGESGEHLRQVISGAKHLGELIEDVLDLSKIEAGRLDISLVAIELAPFLDECLVLAGPLAEARNITIVDKVDQQAIGQIVADPTRLKQVLLNILSNAVKYNSEGGSIVIETSDGTEGMLRLSVTDSGPGIPADRHGEVFEAFSRLGAEKHGIEGTGIGLTISRQLMELMGGSLDFDSTLGKGSRFWLDVPNGKP
jgi:PAS domain S-box-containing protein